MKRIDLRIVGALYAMGGRGFGYNIMRTAWISSARFYPSIERLERYGWVTSDWETGRGNRRREYRLVENFPPLKPDQVGEPG